MSPPGFIQGLHHVTATVDGAQQDLDFYAGVLGLRLTKKTVNFDNHRVYHFYYGNAEGTPGTLMTTFPYRGHGVRVGVTGPGQVEVTSFSVPGGLDFWVQRLEDAGHTAREVRGPFGETGVACSDTSGLRHEIIVSTTDDRTPWTTDEVNRDVAIRGLHSVKIQVKDAQPTLRFVQDVLGFEIVERVDDCTRLTVGRGGPGHYLDVFERPDAEPGVNGLGTVHHVAWAVENDDAQLAVRAELVDRGVSVTPVMDRSYFHSIYFREPGNVLFEIATVPPGFLIDESAETLGRHLRLPEWEEQHRADIEAGLEPVVY